MRRANNLKPVTVLLKDRFLKREFSTIFVPNSLYNIISIGSLFSKSVSFTKFLDMSYAKFLLCFKIHIHKVFKFCTVIFLSKVLYSTFKYALIFFSDYIDSNIFTNSLRVAHLAKHPAVRAYYTLDGII